MSDFGEIGFAARFRDWARRLIRKEVEERVPSERYGLVTRVNYLTSTAEVQYDGETERVPVRFSENSAPNGALQRVRIGGLAESRRIEDVVDTHEYSPWIHTEAGGTYPTLYQGTTSFSLHADSQMQAYRERSRITIQGLLKIASGTGVAGYPLILGLNSFYRAPVFQLDGVWRSLPIGTMFVQRTNGARYFGMAFPNTNYVDVGRWITMQGHGNIAGQTGPTDDWFGVDPEIALVSGDLVGFHLVYRPEKYPTTPPY